MYSGVGAVRVKIGGTTYRLNGSRLIALALAAAVWFALPALLGAHAGAPARRDPAVRLAPSEPATTAYGESSQGTAGLVPGSVVVQRGDTLWGLAVRFAPTTEDPRAWIESLRALNHLNGSVILPGQRLVLPISSR